ncbi:MAG TPA: oligosaccharide flippase family protein [Terriglobia bacterium]|nr:oligosaccharide flippase family protein [Terriglobia bacterium]
MEELKRLYQDSSHYLVGRVCLLLLGFVSFPLFTRLFSVSQYGVINLVFKVVLAATVLSKLGIQNSVLRFYEEHAVSREGKSLRQYYSTLFFGPLGIALAVTVLFTVGVAVMPPTLVSAPIKRLLIFASLLIVIRSVWSILAGFLRVEGKTKTYNVFDVLIKAETIALICVLLFMWKRSVWSFFAGTIAAEGTIALLVVALLFRRRILALKAFDTKFMRVVVAFGLPLVVYELASVILDSGDRVLVQYYLGAKELGYYSAAYNLSYYIQEALGSPLNLALVPLYMKLWVTKGRAETQRFLSESFDVFLMIAVGICATVVVTSRDAIIFLASSKFQRAHELLPILVIGVMLYALHIFLTAGLLIYKRTLTMARQVVYACVLNILLNVVLIPRVGLKGAAIATLVSYGFLILLMARASFQILPIGIRFLGCASYLAAALATWLLVSRIQMKTVLFSLAARGIASMLAYTLLVCLLDRRTRMLIKQLLPWPRDRRTAEEAMLAGAISTAKDLP